MIAAHKLLMATYVGCFHFDPSAAYLQRSQFEFKNVPSGESTFI
jgi:hypothetical protein